MTKVGQTGTYHDQVGYWLWEPASETVMHSLTIPRGQTVLAAGKASADAKQFTLTATRGDTDYGICSNPYLEKNFRTDSFTITVTIHDDGSWSYDEDTVMQITGQSTDQTGAQTGGEAADASVDAEDATASTDTPAAGKN